LVRDILDGAGRGKLGGKGEARAKRQGKWTYLNRKLTHLDWWACGKHMKCDDVGGVNFCPAVG
jgi:hypothetical protein